MDNRNRNIILALFAAVVALSVAAAVVFLMTTENEAQIHNAETARFASHALADELRQSSDDLTRMARLYTVTGDERYKGYFQTILDIRNGDAPRPERYGGIYWDLAVADGALPPGRSAGARTESLRNLAEAAGYTSDDLALFDEAERNSLDLAELEDAALDVEPSVEEMVVLSIMSTLADEDVETMLNSLDGAAYALHGAEYNRRKADVMRPIDELLVTLDERHTQDVSDGESTRYTLIPILLGALGLAALAGIGGVAWTLMAFRRGG